MLQREIICATNSWCVSLTRTDYSTRKSTELNSCIRLRGNLLRAIEYFTPVTYNVGSSWVTFQIQEACHLSIYIAQENSYVYITKKLNIIV